MTLRLTAKAKTKLRIPVFDPEPEATEAPFLHEWFVNHTLIGRKQFFVFSEAKTLFTVFLPGAGVNSRARFEEMATDVVFGLFKRHREITQEMFEKICGSFSIVKTNNQRIIGSQNDLIFGAQVEAEYREEEARLEKINRTPLSYLTEDHSPDLAFERMLKGLK